MEDDFLTAREAMMDEVYRAYQRDVYRVCLYFTRDEYAAQDVMQKTFYEFYLHYDTVNHDCIRAYLLRSARNLSYNWNRDRKREVQGDYLGDLPEIDVTTNSVEEEYINKEERDASKKLANYIMECVKEENESWYEILNLLYCLDKPHDVVAYELNITKEVLYSKLYRAKKWIRRRFNIDYRCL